MDTEHVEDNELSLTGSLSVEPGTTAVKLRKFTRDVLVNGISTLATLAIGFTHALVLPAFLSLEQFGLWRTFFLYVGYAGFANFGFADGVLLRWAALDVQQSSAELSKAFRFLFWQQLIVLTPIGVVIFFMTQPSQTPLVISILIGIAILNFLTTARFYLQASLQFKRLTLANGLVSLIFILGVGILILIGRLATSLLIILYLTSIAAGFFLVVGSDIRRRGNEAELSWPTLSRFGVLNTRSGFFILMGNVNLILAITIDKLVVNWTQSIEDFALYSFAGTAIALVYQAISAVSQVLFPHLMKLEQLQQDRLYHFAKHMVIVVAGLSLATFFPLRFAVLRIYPEYSTSIEITRVLLLSTCFGAVFRLVQANYFKARYQQRNFFLFGMIVNVSFLVAAFLVSGRDHLVYFAWVNIVASSVWYIANDLHLHNTMHIGLNRMSRGLVAIVSFGAWFWLVSSFAIREWWGLALYLVGACGLAAIVLLPERHRLRFFWNEIVVRNSTLRKSVK